MLSDAELDTDVADMLRRVTAVLRRGITVPVTATPLQVEETMRLRLLAFPVVWDELRHPSERTLPV